VDLDACFTTNWKERIETQLSYAILTVAVLYIQAQHFGHLIAGKHFLAFLGGCLLFQVFTLVAAMWFQSG
jgi:hypothetical protein